MNKKNEIDIPVNPSYTESDIQENAKKIFKELKKELGKVNSSQFKVAFMLWWIKQNEAYKYANFENIYKFAEYFFGLSRGSCNNYLNITERFAKKLGNTLPTELEEQYKAYKFSQLVLMKNLDDNDIQKLLPEMSTREMQKQIKNLTSVNKISDSLEQAPEISVECVEIKRNFIFSIQSYSDYESKLDEILEKVKKAFEENAGEIEIYSVSKISQSSND